MTLYEFNALDEMEQAEAAWNGAQIGERFDGVNDILLYQIEKFYVEVYYSRESNIITRLRSFSNTDQLAPYIDKIDISKLTE